MQDNNISKETKMHIAKELLSSFVRGEGGKNVKPGDLGELYKTVYDSIDQAFPEIEKRKIGLGS